MSEAHKLSQELYDWAINELGYQPYKVIPDLAFTPETFLPYLSYYRSDAINVNQAMQGRAGYASSQTSNEAYQVASPCSRISTAAP